MVQGLGRRLVLLQQLEQAVGLALAVAAVLVVVVAMMWATAARS